jgi:transcriptional regulator with XRE-family HTH domain
MDMHQAVKELRNRLELSQQVFATNLGLSIRAISNYEKDRIPGARPLAQLEQCAIASKQPDLAQIFADALANHLRLGRSDRPPLTPEERYLERAFYRCAFEQSKTPEAARVRRVLRPFVDQLRKEDQAAARQLEALRRLK